MMDAGENPRLAQFMKIVDKHRKLGVRTDDLLLSQPDTGEQALEIAEALVRSGAVDVGRVSMGQDDPAQFGRGIPRTRHGFEDDEPLRLAV